jgi:hypothetical protein
MCNPVDPLKKKFFDRTHSAIVRNQKRTINSVARLGPSLLAAALLAPALLAAVLLAPRPASAIVTLRVQQVGNDVVITGSGTANTTDLTSAGTDNDFTNVLSDAQIYAGPDVSADTQGGGGDVSLWSGLTGPLSFGSDNSVFENPSSGSDDLFGILADNGSSASRLVLPLLYASGATLSGTSTFTGITLARLGLTPGQISTWSWGADANADSLRLEVVDPNPVPAPLPIAGAAAVFCRLKRLRRRSRRLHA